MKLTGTNKEIIKWIKDITISLLIVWFIVTFIVQNTKVDGPSMLPTLQNGNYLIINKLIYNFSFPHRGDIIVFSVEGYERSFYIKRIIGLPGEEIDIRDGIVFINGSVLDEDYISGLAKDIGDVDYPFIIPKGEYFVIGDNRSNSFDSRYSKVGTVPKEDIVGKASVRLWPLSEFGGIY